MRKLMIVSVSMLLIVLSASPALCSSIVNPSFENNGSISDIAINSPSGWSVAENPSKFSGSVLNNWSSEGSYSLSMFSGLYATFGNGDNVSVWQDIDLTGITEVMFDAKLDTQYPTFYDFSGADFEALFLIDGIVRWTGTFNGEYLDQTVDVTGLSGVHKVEFRMEATSQISVPYYYYNVARWDNLRAIPEPCTLLLLGLGAATAVRKR